MVLKLFAAAVGMAFLQSLSDNNSESLFLDGSDYMKDLMFSCSMLIGIFLFFEGGVCNA